MCWRLALSDSRHIIAKGSLAHDFGAVCHTHSKFLRKILRGYFAAHGCVLPGDTVSVKHQYESANDSHFAVHDVSVSRLDLVVIGTH